MQQFRPLTLLLLASFLISCGGDEEIKTSSLDINADASALLGLVNGHRASGATCGTTQKEATAGLIWDDALAKAALDHSNDMQQNDYFDHTGLNGSKFSERAKAAGFEGTPLGENIALGYGSEEAVISGWMESAGHCNNIMNGNATHIGIAKSAEGNYWTMILGKI